MIKAAMVELGKAFVTNLLGFGEKKLQCVHNRSATLANYCTVIWAAPSGHVFLPTLSEFLLTLNCVYAYFAPNKRLMHSVAALSEIILDAVA
jgi:hypothetical protein